VAELLWILAGLTALLAITGWVCQKIRLPPALGYLIVGVALPEAVTDARLQEIVHLEEISRVAVLILLFFIGMELDLRTLRKVLRETRIVSIFNIVVPGLLVTGLARLIGWSLVEALVLGFALSLSSTIFGERLSAGRDFPASARRRMFGVLLAEDVAAAALLALLAVLAGGTAGAGLLEPLTAIGILIVSLVVLAALALLVVPKVIDAVAALHSQELTILASGAFLLLLGAAGEWAGSGELGAFLAGMAAAEAGSRFVVRNALSGLRSISLALFFFASGLVVDPLVALSAWPLVLACVVVVTVSKIMVHTPSAMAKGLGLDDALRVGFAMSTVGEFSLILVAAAVASGIAHPALSATITGTIVGLLLIAPLLMLGSRAIGGALRGLPKPMTRPLQAMFQGLRRDRATPIRRIRKRDVARTAAAILIVLVIAGTAVAANVWAPGQFPNVPPTYLTTVVFGLALALAAPFAYPLFQGYRRSMRRLLLVQESPRRTDRWKLRIANSLVAIMLLLLAIPLAVVFGASWVLIAGSLFLATIVALVAWRYLARVTATLEGTVARVLGSEEDAPVLLDQAIATYGWDFKVTAINLPHDSALVGQALEEVRIREKTGATIAVIKRGDQEIVHPPPTQRLRFGDTIVLIGDPGQLARAEALLEAGEEPLRMAAESRAATVGDVEVEADSWFTQAARTLAEVEDKTGAIIIGEWHKGDDHPIAWRDDHMPTPGDRIIAIGGPLQISRLRALAARPLTYEETLTTDHQTDSPA
jgi:monovalent cation:H+ antiporter-2, CPA2 family